MVDADADVVERVFRRLREWGDGGGIASSPNDYPSINHVVVEMLHAERKRMFGELSQLVVATMNRATGANLSEDYHVGYRVACADILAEIHLAEA